ncbi:MAG: hypothetical protein BMS9Abin39_0267 [Ignavibacteria bacterium]|nr:MAG: hypothetical protein BMS9Abin39_0267 [Ignavibacteria bacterium]
MGQQQFLLIVLGVIVVGVAIALSITLFRANAIDRKREILVNESHNIGSIAISYYKRPTMIGGGGNTFTGWKIPSALQATVNGSYSAQVSANNVVITGTGTEVVTDGDSIKVQTTVTGNEINSIIIN